MFLAMRGGNGVQVTGSHKVCYTMMDGGSLKGRVVGGVFE